MRKLSSCRAFTLVELLVVMSIIVILSTVVAVNLWPELENAKRTAAREQIAAYSMGLARYRAAHAMLPTQRQGLFALYAEPTTAPVPEDYPAVGYMESLEMKPDPWSNEYLYFSPGRKGEAYEIASFGADGEEGGDGKNADISSSDH